MNANTQDRYARLTAQVEYPESWQPEGPATLVGELVRWETGTTKSGKTEEIAILRDAEGVEHSVWCWAAQLKYRLIVDKETFEATGYPPPEDRLAKVGDFIAIHYRGKFSFIRDDGEEGEAHSYKVAIDNAPESDVEADTSDFLARPAADDDITF